MNHVLDFVVIGAQKSGTTTLFKYLSVHPQIFIPPEKEAPFFSRDDRYEKGWEWYREEFFGNAPVNRLWGTVTPHYMGNSSVPDRLARQCPEARLIAILREPIERAYSHYRMNVRRQVESRSFHEAVLQMTREPQLTRNRLVPDPRNAYIAWSEYGRILGGFRDYYPADRLLVIYANQLESEPENVLRRIYRFLEIQDCLPSQLGRRFHQGGTRERVPHLNGILRTSPFLWIRKLLPERFHRRLKYWFLQWNILPDPPGQGHAVPLPSETMESLQTLFTEDAKQLEVLTGTNPHWIPYRVDQNAHETADSYRLP